MIHAFWAPENNCSQEYQPQDGKRSAWMRQVLGPGALGRPRRIGWRGRWEGGSGWGIHVNPWLIHVNI